MLHQKLLKLCDLDKNVSVCSPLVDLVNSPRNFSVRYARHAITIKDWTSFKYHKRGIYLHEGKRILQGAHKKDIPLSPCLFKNKFSGLLARVLIEPNTFYAFEMRLKSDTPLPEAHLVIAEHADLVNNNNYISCGPSTWAISHGKILNTYICRQSIILSGKIDFLSDMRTKFITIRLAFTKAVKLSDVYLSNAQLFKITMSREKELLWAYSKYSNCESDMGILAQHGIKKKVAFSNLEEEDYEYRTAIFAATPTVIKYKLSIPKKGKLSFGYSSFRGSNRRFSNRIQFAVDIKLGKDKEENLFTDDIDCQNEKQYSKWHDALVDLSAYQGKEATVVLKTNKLASRDCLEFNKDSKHGYALWGNPIIYSDAPSNQNSNIIFISMDALTMSHLGCYGYKKRQTSPTIDKIAMDGVRFNNCISASNWTLPSHMAMLTGNYPLRFKKKNKSYVIDKEVKTIGEILGKKGYFTAAFTGNAWLSEESFTKGFDIYHSRWMDKSGEMETNLKSILKFIQARKNNRFFIFWHSYETHHPFIRKVFLTNDLLNKHLRFNPDEPDSILSYLENIDKKNIRPSSYEVDCMEALLDGSIRYADNLIDALLHRLTDLDILDRTMLIFTSDHGNLLLSETKHAANLSEDIIKVPLIIKGKGVPQNRAIDIQVRTIDIAPTILDFLGIAMPAGVDGRSLKPLIMNNEKSTSVPIAFSVSDMGGTERILERKDSINKLLYTPSQNEARFYHPNDNCHKVIPVSEIGTPSLLKKKDIVKFIISSLPKQNFYLWFFGTTSVFNGTLRSKDKFDEDFYIFFGGEKDFCRLSEDMHVLEFKIDLTEGYKNLSFRMSSNLCPIEANINLNGHLLSTDSIYFGQKNKKPETNPFVIGNFCETEGLKIPVDDLDSLLRNPSCILGCLADSRS